MAGMASVRGCCYQGGSFLAVKTSRTQIVYQKKLPFFFIYFFSLSLGSLCNCNWRHLLSFPSIFYMHMHQRRSVQHCMFLVFAPRAS